MSVHADAVDALAAAGIRDPLTGLHTVSGGEDNELHCGFLGDRQILVKDARQRPGRFAGAAEAAGRLAAAGVPVAEVVAYTDRVGIEICCPGHPLDHPPALGISPTAWQSAVSAAAGALLRRLHTIPANRVGRLCPNDPGVHGHATIAEWRCAVPATPKQASFDTRRLLAVAHRTLLDTVDLLPDVKPRMLHGDWRAAHVIALPQLPAVITGIVDLQSVRGGDPLVELASWSLQEPRPLTAALFRGYRLNPHDPATRLRLTVNRIRVAASLLVHDLRTTNPAGVLLRAAQLRHDIEDLTADRPRALPAITPAEARKP